MKTLLMTKTRVRLMATALAGILASGSVACSSGSEVTAPTVSQAAAAETPAPQSADTEAQVYLSLDPDAIATELERQDAETPTGEQLGQRVIVEQFSGSASFALPTDLPPDVTNYRATVVCSTDDAGNSALMDLRFETASGESVGIRGQACGALAAPTIEPPDGLLREVGLVSVGVDAPASLRIALIVHQLTGKTE